MTKLPGISLFGKYWNFTPEQREEIVPKAVKALHSIYMLGIEPVDRGLRNVIWEPETKQCGIIDFELWNETKQTFGDEKAEMQRWGLVRTPPAKDHWAAVSQVLHSKLHRTNLCSGIQCIAERLNHSEVNSNSHVDVSIFC